MSTDTVGLQIAASAFKDQIPKDGSLEDRLMFAFRYVLDPSHERDIFWMSGRLTSDMRFRTALAAILMTGSEEDRARINESLNTLRAFNAMLSGVPVDFSAVDTENAIPLMKLFREVEAEVTQ
jgi:hypothetical protein